jgi:hypothetical protein
LFERLEITEKVVKSMNEHIKNEHISAGISGFKESVKQFWEEFTSVKEKAEESK